MSTASEVTPKTEPMLESQTQKLHVVARQALDPAPPQPETIWISDWRSQAVEIPQSWVGQRTGRAGSPLPARRAEDCAPYLIEGLQAVDDCAVVSQSTHMVAGPEVHCGPDQCPSKVAVVDPAAAPQAMVAPAVAVQQEQSPGVETPPVIARKDPVTAEVAESTASLKQQMEPDAAPVPAPARNNGEGTPAPETEAAPKKKVLAIDDDVVMRKLLKIGLPPHGYLCETAENGKVAQEVLQRFRPDLILLDLLMPVMDGLSFIHWLRQTARDNTPVLVFTNLGGTQITQEALHSGANSVASKPLHFKELLQAMRQLVPA